MMVFFKNIPPNTQKKELINFIKPAMKRNFFPRLFYLPGTIVDITLLNLLNKEELVANLNGVVTIMPDYIAVRVIKELDKRIVNGRRIFVREYHLRSEQNDPRKANKVVSQDIIDKRIFDRRQYELVLYSD